MDTKAYADLRKVKDIAESNFKSKYYDEEDFKGNVALVEIKKVLNEWRVDTEGRLILANGFNWLEMYPEGENYAITAAYDIEDKIVEWYIDMCKENGIEDGMPYEDDLFLDVVIVPDGRINILDEDELLDAEKNGIITRQDVELAYKVKDEIIEKYGHNIKKLEELTNKYLNKIREEE